MDRSERALHAQRLLGDQLLNEILNQMGEEVVRSWKASTTPEERETAFGMWQASQEFQRRLRALVDDGIMADRAAKRRG